MSTVTFLPLFFGTVLESANSKKNAGDELTSSLTRQIDTQKNRPRANSRRTDDARIRARIRKKNSVSPRVFFVVVGRALREKSRLGERIVIDRFFVRVRELHFLNEKKSVTNTFRGDEFRPKTRAGGSPSNLAGLSRGNNARFHRADASSSGRILRETE